MSADAAVDRHNRLARDYVARAGRETANEPELLMVIESANLATMLLLQELYGYTARDAALFVDEAVARATERLAAFAKQSGAKR